MKPELIVMLTHDDLTVENAYQVFEECRTTKATYWGFKEQPLPLAEMQRIYARMKECGKRTVLEVVAYTEAEGLEGAQMAAACGVDVLMGTCYHESILKYCVEHAIRYMPFVGHITGRPSVLQGSVDSMLAEAATLQRHGASGIDLLGYRYDADAQELIAAMVAQCGVPVCVAGSVDSYKRLQFIKDVQPWAFTIGSAFFEHKFGASFAEQVDAVCDFISA